MNFNQRQEEAIRHKDGPMMVLAGPGSGKTSVITGRIQKLIAEGVAENSILVVTFTRAAAMEMRTRFLGAVKEKGREVTFGTFHSIYFAILRSFGSFRNMQVIGETDKQRLIREILSGIAPDFASERELPLQVVREISLQKNSGTDLRHFYSTTLPQDVFQKLFLQYERWKSENRLLDFDDIIVRCDEVLQREPAFLHDWQRRFRYFLIDEFQDVSPLQYRIIRRLALPENNLFIVGDDDQSIYRFRGANPEIMLHFPKDYPGCALVNLNINYRSRPVLLSAASRLIGRNKKRFKKELRSNTGEGGRLTIREFHNPREECRHLTDELRQEHEKGRLSYEETAILVRTNAGIREAAEQLMAGQIPFDAPDLITGIYDHWICKDLLAYLRLAAGERERGLFLKIYNRPNRYFSREAFSDKIVTFDLLYDYYEDREWMADRVEKLESDLRLMKNLPPYGAILYIRRQIGYDEFLKTYALERHIPPEELFQILDELMESAREYRNLRSWMQAMETYREMVQKQAERRKREDKQKGVRLTTLHASKGLEYDSVYILDVNEGILPYKKALLEADIEEERRMLYVGMTRARRDLHLFYVKERYDKEMKPSRFLTDLRK